MNRAKLIERIREVNSYLCVGLDTDIEKIPAHLKEEEDPVFAFNKAIIDATLPYCVSYKINTAFYEAQGLKGWASLEKTVNYIPSSHFKIADAKRGDIGNTSTHYANAFFKTLPFDSITVAPYMGKDSVKPFLDIDNKWTIVLGLTSNEGAFDFQTLSVGSEKLFETVLRKVSEWGSIHNLMFVVGATKAEQLAQIRQIIPNHFLLIPGVGTQGGSLEDVSKYGMNDDIGILVNVSRQIIYAGNDHYFAEKAREEALKLQREMASYL